MGLEHPRDHAECFTGAAEGWPRRVGVVPSVQNLTHQKAAFGEKTKKNNLKEKNIKLFPVCVPPHYIEESILQHGYGAQVRF